MKYIAVVAFSLAAFAHSALANEDAAKKPLLGSWSVDTTKLPMAASARPKSVTITFSEDGVDRLRAKIEVVDPSGKLLDAEGVTPLDGTPTKVKSNFEADVSATTMPRPEILIMQLGKNGNPASTRIYTVSPDGKAMIETVAYFTSDGQPVLRKNYFSRIR
jgi:methionine-rich copper-binding protein CopC